VSKIRTERPAVVRRTASLYGLTNTSRSRSSRSDSAMVFTKRAGSAGRQVAGDPGIRLPLGREEKTQRECERLAGSIRHCVASPACGRSEKGTQKCPLKVRVARGHGHAQTKPQGG